MSESTLRFIKVKPPNPEGAPREQWFEYGIIQALQGGDILHQMGNHSLIETLKQAYNTRWFPDEAEPVPPREGGQ